MNKTLKILCIITPIIILILSITLFFIFKSSSTSFRNIKLGMTAKEVVNIEKKKNNCTQFITVVNTCMFMDAKFDNYTGNVLYVFDDSERLDYIDYTIKSASQTDYKKVKNYFKSKRYTIVNDNGTSKTILKKGKSQIELSYNSIKDEISINIQEYKKEGKENV